MGSGSEQDIAEAAPKRSLFKKSTWAKPAEQDEALKLFSRSKEIFPDIVAENSRQLRSLERSRTTASTESIDSKALDRKKRRIYRDSEGSSSDDEPSAKHLQDGSVPNAASPRKSSSDNDLNSPTHEKSSSSLRGSRTGKLKQGSPHRGPRPHVSAIDLSDSDSDLSIEALKNNAKHPSIHLGFDSEDEEEEIIKQPKVVKHIVELVSDEEEFPEFVAKARENARRKGLERLNPTKPSNHSETLSRHGPMSNSDISETVRPSISVPVSDPGVQILVTSEIHGTKPLILKRKLSQRLKDVRLCWCDRQIIDGQPMPVSLKHKIFLTWRGSKVFDVTTCKAMGIPIDTAGKLSADEEGFDPEGRVHLEAWTEEIFEQFKKRKANERKRRVLDILKEMEDDEPEEIEQKKEQRIKIVLMSKEYPELKLDTSLTTPVLKMIGSFRAVNKLPSDTIISLQLDGTTLDPGSNVGDMEDLEDIMTIDVHLKT